MKPILFFLSVYLVLASWPIDVEAQGKSVENGYVLGVVSMRADRGEDWVVPDVELVLETDGKVHHSVSDLAGRYVMAIPSGTYTVRASALGYCSAMRASFRVEAGKTTTVNLYLYVCGISNIIHTDEAGRYVGEECRVVDPFATDRYEIRGMGNMSRDVVIRYGVRRSSNGQVVYQRLTDGEYKRLPVVASYDAYTVYADEMEYDAAQYRLTARGNVLIDANGVRTTMAQTRIQLGPEGVVVGCDTETTLRATPN